MPWWGVLITVAAGLVLGAAVAQMSSGSSRKKIIND